MPYACELGFHRPPTDLFLEHDHFSLGTGGANGQEKNTSPEIAATTSNASPV